jgi:K+-transporting ATPase ATPase A chain
MGTTAGATDSALDSYTPVGGAGAFVGILLGEVSPGGDGGGLYSMLVLSLLAVFVAGLMVGRTPEFLGKKFRAPQMKLVLAYVLTIPVVVLVFGSLSLVIGPGTRSILNPGFHGLSEVTYAFASVANNNGSAFAGQRPTRPGITWRSAWSCWSGGSGRSCWPSPSPARWPGRASTPGPGPRSTPAGPRSSRSCSG